MDTTRLSSPYVRTRASQADVEQRTSPCKKYILKPPKDFTSKYDAYMHERYVHDVQADRHRTDDEERARVQTVEQPLVDPLDGVRVHAWVLVLSGKCDVVKSFYIEPTTGHAKETTDRDYSGVESVWNDQNYWVNMQDGSQAGEVCLSRSNDRR